VKQHTIQHEFVEFMPERLEEGTLYVSVHYATAVHKCCCGCGNDVFTPLSPADWKLTFDGRTVSLFPSIGNWSFACQSHYWIRNNRIEWARRWSQDEIEAGRAKDARRRQKQYTRNGKPDTLWHRIKKRF